MKELLLVVWAFLYWGDAFFTHQNFASLKTKFPATKFYEYEMNPIAAFLESKFGFSIAAFMLYLVGMVTLAFLLTLESNLNLVVGFIIGAYFVIFTLHIYMRVKIKKEIKHKNI